MRQGIQYIERGDRLPLGGAIKADLHIHSSFSDGEYGISQIVEMAQEKGLDLIAITDHDTMEVQDRLIADSPHNDRTEQFQSIQGLVVGAIKVIAGVEISAIYKGTKTKAHVLGYNIQRPEIITALTRPLLEARNRNSEKQAEILIENGFRIDIGKLPKADGKYLYKQHILEWLFATGQTPDMFGTFYNKTFKNGGVCDFDIEYIDVFEAVKTIKEAGGVAVLAHPGQQQNFWMIPQLAKAGLDGLELNHHAHNEKDRQIICGYAEQYCLFLTGGSDYHGKYGSKPFFIGDFLSDESGITALCRRLG